MRLRKLLAAVLVGVMTVSSLAISAFAADEKGTVPAPGEFDANGEYVAQMYVQMDGSWVFRNKWDDKDYGTAMGYQYAGQLSQVEGENAVPYDGTFTDVTLKGNGTYTIKLENPNFVKDVNGTKTEPKRFNMIGISTNIPASAQDTVKITDATIKINDSSMYTYTWKEALVDEEDEDYMLIPLLNVYNDKGDYDAVNEQLGGDESTFMGEVTSIEITFTVSGFGYDKAVEATTAEETTAAAADTATKAADTAKTDSSSSNGLPTPAIIGIVAAVVVVVVVIVVVATSKKKKAN